MIDADQFDELARQRDWASIDAMLDAARSGAKTREDLHSATHWRIAALKRQGRYTGALACLRENAPVYNCQSYVKHQAGRLLFRIGQETQALNEVKEAPLDLEVATFQAPVLEAGLQPIQSRLKSRSASSRGRYALRTIWRYSLPAPSGPRASIL